MPPAGSLFDLQRGSPRWFPKCVIRLRRLHWRRSSERAAPPGRAGLAPAADALTSPRARKWCSANEAFPDLWLDGALRLRFSVPSANGSAMLFGRRAVRFLQKACPFFEAHVATILLLGLSSWSRMRGQSHFSDRLCKAGIRLPDEVSSVLAPPTYTRHSGNVCVSYGVGAPNNQEDPPDVHPDAFRDPRFTKRLRPPVECDRGQCGDKGPSIFALEIGFYQGGWYDPRINKLDNTVAIGSANSWRAKNRQLVK